MKRLIMMLLTIAMLLNLSACAAPEKRETQSEEMLYGFQLVEKREFPLVGAEVMHFEHVKTGAKLLYIANSDTNRVFDLTFLTRAEDNTGLPHVFEHAALKGSEKYPDSGLFFDLLYQTYNTFMNAETGPNYTTYPVASLSEEQLLAYADYYTDSCLHPRVLEDESIFREEAWRYRLEDADAPLTIEGTVYSEMRAAVNLYQTSYYDMLRTAFPGSVCGNISGGDPASIPDMTWEALKAYHAKYYHPSNSIAYLYGAFEDYTAFLKLLDGYFSAYDRQAFSFEDAAWTPIHGEHEVFTTFPVEAGSDTEGASEMYYVFLCPGLKEDSKEELYLNTLTDLMGADASPVSRSLQEALPAAFLSTWISMGTPVDAIVFNVSGINPEDAHTARDAIDAGLREIAEKGFSDKLMDSVSSALNMNMRLSRENTALGVSLLTGQMIPYYAETGRVFDCLDYMESLRELENWNRKGVYSDAVREWLLGCEDRIVTVTSPEPGAREQLDAAREARLAEVKNSMNTAELSALLTGNAEEEETDDTAAVKQLQAVTVASLPEEIRHYDIREETDSKGIRRLTATADVEDVGAPVILLDAAGVPQEDLHWFVLYLSLLGQMDTVSHSREELQELSARYLFGGEFRQSLMDEYGTESYHPYLRAAWLSSGEDLDKSYELMYELLFETEFTDTETLAGLLERNRGGLKSLISSSAYDTMMYRELGAETPLYAYYSYCNGLDYYAFLERVCTRMREDPDEVTRKLEQIQSLFHNRTNAVSVFAGAEELVERNRDASDRFFSRLDAAPVKAVCYSFEVPAMNEALVVDETVQYNGLIGSFETMGLQRYTADMDAVASLVTDICLIPQLREEYGVYTPMHYYDSFGGTYLISYRDPNIEETFAVYDTLPELLAAEAVDQETLDGYILSCYSSYAMPEGELSGAISAITSRLCGEPENLKVQHMEELKSLTPERLQAYGEVYESLAENGRRFTVGSESAVSAHEELYDNILRPFSI